MDHKTQRLERTVASLRATLDATSDGLLVLATDQAVVHYNASFLRMWSITPAELQSRPVFDLLCSRVRNGTTARIHFECALPLPPHHGYALDLADGRTLECSSQQQMVEGVHVGRVWCFRDVTEQRRAQERLRQDARVLEVLNATGKTLASQLDLDALVQNVTDAATDLSRAEFGAFFYNQTNEQGRTYRLYVLSGAPREAFAKLGHPRATPIFAPTFEGGPPIRCDDVLQDSRYGTLGGMPPGHLPVRSYLAVSVVSRSGEVIGGLFFGHSRVGVFDERAERLVAGIASQAAIAIDNARLYEASQRAAAERKELLESERSARSAAERSSALKDDFLAIVSHELRTPLSAILGWAQMLRLGRAGEAQLEKGLATIERNARAQTQLIDDLLDMSRILAGKVRLDLQAVEPAAFIEAAVDTVRPTAAAKGVALSLRLDRNVGTVHGDPGRLQQILWNLLSNAIKFTPQGGQIRVELRRVHSHLEVSVSDTGVGIAAEFLPHVFDRFRQAENASTRRHGGLGLGLSIVKHVVELHGGTVRAESAGKDRGATFVVSLLLDGVQRPSAVGLTAPATPAATGVDFYPADLKGSRILVVDDEEDSRELIGRVLAECGAEALCASGAEEALALLERERPDALVSDIGMPEVDGYELLRRVRRAEAARYLRPPRGSAALPLPHAGVDHSPPNGRLGGRIPAIALTAFARPEDRMRALRAGFLVHLSKPVEPSELVASVATVLGRAGLD